MSLSMLLELTLMQFLDFLLLHTIKKNIYIPFNSLIEEYNQRLDQLITMITRDDYKKLTWPIGEFVDLDISNESKYWTLKFWNRSDFFQMIRKQLKDLMCLSQPSISLNDESEFSDENKMIDFSIVEKRIFDYLKKLIDDKIKIGNFPPHSECLKSIYQLESQTRKGESEFCLFLTYKFICQNLKSTRTQSDFILRHKQYEKILR